MKPLDAMLQPHPTSTRLSYSRPNADDSQGEWKRLDLDYYYSTARDCALPQEAPKDIRLLWETAQHLLAYAYFEYSFVITADYLSTQVVEIALRKECAAQIAEFNRQRAEQGKKTREPNFPEVLGLFKEKTLTILAPEEAQFLLDRLGALAAIRNQMGRPQFMPLYLPNQSVMTRTSEWLGAYYQGRLKQFVQAWMKWSQDIKR